MTEPGIAARASSSSRISAVRIEVSCRQTQRSSSRRTELGGPARPGGSVPSGGPWLVVASSSSDSHLGVLDQVDLQPGHGLVPPPVTQQHARPATIISPPARITQIWWRRTNANAPSTRS